MGVLGGGHVLLEDVPGVGKTTLAKALARTLRIAFTRVQFTPDLLPTDILGSQVLNPSDGSFAFHKGPVFTNVLLADEINRASPRTQSALLEAMNEAQVTVDGVTPSRCRSPSSSSRRRTPSTTRGRTRSRRRSSIASSSASASATRRPTTSSPCCTRGSERTRSPAVDAGLRRRTTRSRMQAEVRDIEVKEPRRALPPPRSSRRPATSPSIELGVSPRGALAFFRASQARAFLSGRTYVSPDDVQALAAPVLAHRIGLTTQARYGGTTTRRGASLGTYDRRSGLERARRETSKRDRSGTGRGSTTSSSAAKAKRRATSTPSRDRAASRPRSIGIYDALTRRGAARSPRHARSSAASPRSDVRQSDSYVLFCVLAALLYS